MITHDDAFALLRNREWRLNNLYKIKDKEGNVVDFQLNFAQKTLLNSHNLNIILKARQLGMCLHPDTLVLKSDLTWIKIGEMNPGDEIVSVDEHAESRGKARRLRKGVVEGTVRHKRNVYKITFDNGKSLICTGQHPWLSRRQTTEWDWRTIEGEGKKKLLVGTKIRRIVADTWDSNTYEDGWMGGMIDGEGSLSNSNRLGAQISVSQLPGAVFDRMHKYFQDHKYTVRIEDDKTERKTKYGKRPVPKLALTRIDQIMRLIGTTRPSRFLPREWWVGKEIPSIKEGSYSTIISIDFLGEQEVVDLQTSVGTYIAEGYVSHNTTFHAILFLDHCLFDPNTNAAIVADNKDVSREIFVDKVKFAYDNLPQFVRDLSPAYRDNVHEMRFANGSVYRVATSLRGGTLQLLHITEFAKVCQENPTKANEIISGALNAVQAGQFVCIESTARGRDGHFYNLCKTAKELQDTNSELTSLDWKLWFFAWWQHPDYVLDSKNILITKDMEEYFHNLEVKGIVLSPEQKAWYIKKMQTQGEYMKREYPSTPDEAFETANEGYYFAKQIASARQERRICYLPYDETARTYTSWDIGIGDSCAIWVWQTIGKEVHCIDYYENSDEPLAHYVKWLKEKPYIYEKHFLPHDAASREKGTGKSFADLARTMGLKVDILERDRNEMFGIECLRNMLPRFFFDQSKCEKGIKAVESFRKEWNEKLGCYRDRSYHDWSSHASKSLIYCAEAVQRTGSSAGMTGEEWARMRREWL